MAAIDGHCVETLGPRGTAVLLVVRTTNLVLAVYWIALFTGTHVPLPPELAQLPGGDKTLHFLAYFGLSVLLALALAQSRGGLTPARYAGMLAGLALYGVLDELLQIPVNRSADVGDWLADVAGVAAGLASVAVVRAVWGRSTRRGPLHAPELLEADRVSSATLDP